MWKVQNIGYKDQETRILLTYLTECQIITGFQKFLTFNLPKFTSHDKRFMSKPLLCTIIAKKNQELYFLGNDVVVYDKDLAKVQFFINKSILDSANKKDSIKLQLRPLKHKKRQEITKFLKLFLPMIFSSTTNYLSTDTKCKLYCQNLNINAFFTLFKVRVSFNIKDAISKILKFLKFDKVVYLSCNAFHIRKKIHQ